MGEKAHKGGERVGKLRSLAMADFRTLRAKHGSHERNHDLVDVLYLVARFWASLELFRGGGQTVSVVRDTRGERLAAFADCLESRRVRIVRRSLQRAVAELALVPGDEGDAMAPMFRDGDNASVGPEVTAADACFVGVRDPRSGPTVIRWLGREDGCLAERFLLNRPDTQIVSAHHRS